MGRVDEQQRRWLVRISGRAAIETFQASLGLPKLVRQTGELFSRLGLKRQPLLVGTRTGAGKTRLTPDPSDGDAVRLAAGLRWLLLISKLRRKLLRSRRISDVMPRCTACSAVVGAPCY